MNHSHIYSAQNLGPITPLPVSAELYIQPEAPGVTPHRYGHFTRRAYRTHARGHPCIPNLNPSRSKLVAQVVVPMCDITMVRAREAMVQGEALPTPTQQATCAKLTHGKAEANTQRSLKARRAPRPSIVVNGS